MERKVNPPDFFLSAAGETVGDLARVRACWKRPRVTEENARDDYMLVEVEPPVTGQRYGQGGNHFSELLLSTRLSGYGLFPVNEWPCHVYITRIVDETILQELSFVLGQVEMIGWGMIFRKEEEARCIADARLQRAKG